MLGLLLFFMFSLPLVTFAFSYGCFLKDRFTLLASYESAAWLADMTDDVSVVCAEENIVETNGHDDTSIYSVVANLRQVSWCSRRPVIPHLPD
jgi:hypothetical protein